MLSTTFLSFADFKGFDSMLAVAKAGAIRHAVMSMIWQLWCACFVCGCDVRCAAHVAYATRGVCVCASSSPSPPPPPCTNKTKNQHTKNSRQTNRQGSLDTKPGGAKNLIVSGSNALYKDLRQRMDYLFQPERTNAMMLNNVYYNPPG